MDRINPTTNYTPSRPAAQPGQSRRASRCEQFTAYFLQAGKGFVGQMLAFGPVVFGRHAAVEVQKRSRPKRPRWRRQSLPLWR